MAGKILIVDDENDIRALIRTMLEMEGFSVIDAKSGNECLKKLTPDIDLILLDIIMPEMDGWETLKQIKKTEYCSTIPVSMLTALPLSPEDTKDKPLNLIENYIIKPFTKNELISKITEIIEKYELIKKRSKMVQEKLGKEIAEEYTRISNSINRHSRLIEAIIISIKGKGPISPTIEQVLKSQERLIDINKQRKSEIEKMII
jgi:two-component system alkaline phosphatase synthesis response regulator PhoP